jgi:hypothetical protein
MRIIGVHPQAIAGDYEEEFVQVCQFIGKHASVCMTDRGHRRLKDKWLKAACGFPV